MEENKKAIKNMEYWKKKNNIPGIEALKSAGLTDGRAGSAPFQMKNSPNKFLGALGQGLVGKGSLGFMNPLMWAGRGVKNTLDKDPTTTNIFGGGGNPQGQFMGGVGQQIPNPAMAAVQTPMTAPLSMKKSPLEQVDPDAPGTPGTPGYEPPVKRSDFEEGSENQKMFDANQENYLGGQEIAKQNENFELDEENGTLMTTEQFGGEEGIPINDPDNILEGASWGDDDFEYSYKVEDDGSYTLTGKRDPMKDRPDPEWENADEVD